MGLAEEELDGRGLKFWLMRGIGALALAVAVVGAAVVLKDIISSTTTPARQVARISLVPDTPPPPPPPPKQEKPEEPKEQKQVQEAPKPQEAPQPSEQLKMEGAGSDNGLAGLQAGPVLREYKGDIGATPAYVSYGGLVQREIQQFLQKAPKLRGVDYRVTVRIWLAPTGEVTRVELAGSSGSGDVDEVLKSSLAELPALKDRPPADMPLPIRLRLTSRT
jgi:protein TonB